MWDGHIRKVIDKPLVWGVKGLALLPVSAIQVTVMGFILGMVGVILTCFGLYVWGLIFVGLNRLFDGVDGALAREKGEVSDRGGYLDIVLDFIFYSAVPVGFGVANVDVNGVTAMVLILSFMGTGSSFLAHAVFAAKRGETTEVQGKKSFYYSSGLMEGGETMVAFLLFYIFPDHFWWIGLVVAFLCVVTTMGRVCGVCDILKTEARLPKDDERT